MQEQNNIDFYNDFCRNLDEFTLLEQFVEDHDMYQGRILANNPYHELIIDVEIPKSFPHNKCHFYTNSLFGYPHLIYLPSQGRSWFCLNTPFEESVEEQLLAEFVRLRGWINSQMRPELCARITNPDTIQGLRTFNAYANENEDEIRELEQKSDLTFVGGFGLDLKNFAIEGVLHCQINNDNLYAYKQNFEGSEDVPYLIVDERPKEKEDFLKMRKQFNWDDKHCEKLLPKFGFIENNEDNTISIVTGEEAVKLSQQRNLPVYGSQEYEEEQEYEDYLRFKECQKNVKWHYFALGIKKESDKLDWLLFTTNLNNKLKSIQFKYEGKTYSELSSTPWESMDEIDSLKLYYCSVRHLEYNEYFGRGVLTDNLTNKSIGIVGLGAIGSVLVETLVRGGARRIELWDGDIVEPGNLCRSIYSREHLGEHKLNALAEKMRTISPFCSIIEHGRYIDNFDTGVAKYYGGDLYGRINYKSQQDVIKEIQNCDVIFDCTASNELLHFLSFKEIKVPIISLCITNRAKDLILISNKNGNPFELRKAYLSKIIQDKQNYYVEGIGCYSPTFMATFCDVQSLSALAMQYINKEFSKHGYVDSCIWSVEEDSIIANKICQFQVESSEIKLYIDSLTLKKASLLPVYSDGSIGFILGTFSRDGKQVMITDIVSMDKAAEKLESIFEETHGIIDYLGDFVLSNGEDYVNADVIENIKSKAHSEDINICNPILAILNTDGTISLKLYINNEFINCIQEK